MNNIEQVPELIKELYKIVKKLEELFPGRPFTPDGHMVGSLGEVIVAHYYNLILEKPSVKGYDAVDTMGRKVQIKATQGNSVALRSEPEWLIIIKILKTGDYEEIYNGAGKIVWDNCGKMQSNGQRAINLNRIKKLKI